MKIHMVKQGDTLYDLAKKYQVDLNVLIEMNPHIPNPDELQVGTKVKVPSPLVPVQAPIQAPIQAPDEKPQQTTHKHIVVQGDSLWKLAKVWNVSLADLIQTNKHLKNPNVLLTGEIVHIPTMTQSPAVNKPAAADISKPEPIQPSEMIDAMNVPKALEMPNAMADDLFAQYNVPSMEVGSFYDLPAFPGIQTPWDQQPSSKGMANPDFYTSVQGTGQMTPPLTKLPTSSGVQPAFPDISAEATGLPADAQFGTQMNTGIPYFDGLGWNPYSSYGSIGDPYGGLPQSPYAYPAPQASYASPHAYSTLMSPFIPMHSPDCGCQGGQNVTPPGLRYALPMSKGEVDNKEATPKNKKKRSSSGVKKRKAFLHVKKKTVKKEKSNLPWINV